MKKQNKQILLSNSKIVEIGEIDISNALMACYWNLDKKLAGLKCFYWSKAH